MTQLNIGYRKEKVEIYLGQKTMFLGLTSFLSQHEVILKTLRRLILLFFLTGFSLTKACAGWYECYNFKGTVGSYPITLSIQTRAGYFGEKDKKDLNIIGVYKYDKHNDPIRLEGKINFNDNKALLYELSDNKHTAAFEFSFSQTECDGVWKDLATNRTQPLHLNFVSKLVDTLNESQWAGIDILQTAALPGFYFVGIYSKTAGDTKARMDKLQVISKKNNTVFQTIDFSKIETPTGNVSTIIYNNVEVVDSKANIIQVWNDVGRMGGQLTISFNNKAQKFILNPRPVVEGPN